MKIPGNTPAYAGKTDSSLRSIVAREKHPRLRGEDHEGIPVLDINEETPPLTRGRLSCSCLCSFFVGNTPAYAGKTCLAHVCAPCLWKHPRLRGEDASGIDVNLNSMETPPLTRGRPVDPMVMKAPSRNTPAYAGKTLSPFFVCVLV